MIYTYMGFPVGTSGNPPVSAGDIRNMGLIPGPGRSRGGGHGNPFQYFSRAQRSLAGCSL